MTKTTTLVLTFAAAIVISAVIAFILLGGESILAPAIEKSSKNSQAPIRSSRLIISPKEYDFGKIKQSGGVVSTSFRVFNNGAEDVIIEGVATSCSCTTAEIDPEGKLALNESGKKTIKPSETAELKVMFDPNYHYESDGRFFRTTTIKSNAQGEDPEVKIWVEVEYDLGKDKLKFPPKE